MTPHGFAVKADIGSAQCSVSAYIGAQHVQQVRVCVIVHGIPKRQIGLTLPPMSCDTRNAGLIQPNVERQGDAVAAEVVEPCAHLVHMRHGRAADHHSIHAQIQHLRHGGGIAQTAAHLQTHGVLCRHLRDDGTVDRACVLGAIKVDHMQPIGSQVAILASRVQGSAS